MITGVGSLPHVDPATAAEFVLTTTDLPYLPQLPLRHPAERMLVQWGDGLCGCGALDTELGLAYGAREGERSEAMVGSEVMLATLDHSIPALKTQATGPVTLAAGMLAAGHPGRGLFECLIDGLGQRIRSHLGAIERQLPGTAVVLVLDEPGLSAVGSRGFPLSADDAVVLLEGVMDSLPNRPGIHCCGPADWGLIANLAPSWISWDIDALGASFEEHIEAVATAVAVDTGIMWGVAPAVMGSPPRDLVSRLQRTIGTLVVGGADMSRITNESMYTPSCGLAGLTEGQAEIVANNVRTVVGELADLWAM